MTAHFDYYELAYPDEGVGSGFRYKTVPDVSPKVLIGEKPQSDIILYDQAVEDRKKSRVAGPFTDVSFSPADDSVARSGETLRQGDWRDELYKTGIRGKAGQRISFVRLEPLPGFHWLHADGETRSDDTETDSERVVISFGPDHAPARATPGSTGHRRGAKARSQAENHRLCRFSVRSRGCQRHRRNKLARRNAPQGANERRSADGRPEEKALQQRKLLAYRSAGRTVGNDPGRQARGQTTGLCARIRLLQTPKPANRNPADRTGSPCGCWIRITMAAACFPTRFSFL